MEDIEKLALCSEMANKYGRNYEIVDFSDFKDRHEDLTFHPNGNCGCLLLNDDYAFGIRCDHLMWAEGTFEYENGDAILIWGNHKGILYAEFLMFHKTE